MLGKLEYEQALGHLLNYFTLVSRTGYVKQSTIDRFMVYLFLIDFVDSIYDFMSEADYGEVSDVLGKLFSAGDCLLPYDEFCTNHIHVAEPRRSSGAFTVRVIEQVPKKRVTQDDFYRTV